MTKKAFTKRLTANDTGESGGHQAGIHVPKGEKDLISFLPELDSSIKNPDAWLSCIDEEGTEWSFRYVYYNNKFHSPGGTRDEYRVTHMTKFFRAAGAHEGDSFRISGKEGIPEYKISVVRADNQNQELETDQIRLTGWRRVH